MPVEQYIYSSVELWGAFFCLVAAFVVYLTRHGDKHKARKLIALMLCCSIQLLADAFTWLYGGDVSLFGGYAGRFACFLKSFSAFGALALTVRYVAYFIERRCDCDLSAWVYVEHGVAAMGVACLLANVRWPFLYTFDYLNRYSRLEYHWVLNILGMLGLALALGVVIRFFDELEVFERLAMACFLLLPFGAAAAQVFVEGPSFVSLSITISAMVLFFAYEFGYAKRYVELERQLSSYRIKLLARQVKPHFIFNCLSLIRYMCRRRPEEAAFAIDEFASYLRGCTDLMDRDVCIPASDEFDLVRHYAYLQERRFEGELRVEYDLRDADFELPAFSVQTSVENAITHGIRGRSPVQGGRIVVRSYQDGDGHVVEVEDNGVGFDTSVLAGNMDGHIGIAATRRRVEAMCGGAYAVASEPGEGTTVTICVPAHADEP